MQRFIREHECYRITGLSSVMRWLLEKEGKFPKRHKLSDNTIGWLSSDLEAWIESKVQMASSAELGSGNA